MFPVISSLAKDYLASSASSCSSEQTFSSAADVCSSGCGSLKPRTMERCFEKAQNIVRNCIDFSQRNSTK
ncbi:hypothetical protein VP01_3982g3 [Puccinia sorghi]|uniref:HAT C-terminal dimerisation domain-containing protein n=1 Tax=Puccinia sorghi TaxID=27349 RepID=A0A0L6UU55_9BASI|nr:hypothetical protein VP01_3982g3 [Puccinia sorghi]